MSIVNSELREKLHNWLASHEKEMVEDICDLCKIDSSENAPEENAPFGPGVASCFSLMKEKLSRYGFTVTDYDNRCLTADLSSGSHLDILAHLDVVPAGEGWTVTEPFSPVVKDGKIFGRGTSDDKGPAVAALYAMRAVKELGIPVSKNARLILGGNEETGSRDIEYYYSKEKEAPMTFSPDADFPLINREKGRMTAPFTASVSPSGEKSVLTLSAGFCGNMVPPLATVTLRGFSEEELSAAAERLIALCPVKVEVETGEDSPARITVTGVGGHASTPDKYVNALTALLTLLSDLPLSEGPLTSLLSGIHALFPFGDHAGKALGIALSDEISGPLTVSLDLLSYDGATLSGQFDARTPFSMTKENGQDIVAGKLSALGFTVSTPEPAPPHYVPEKLPFVQTLLEVYTEVTGQKGYTMAIGGGTYVHELERGVAFGCADLAVDNHMHGPDEFVLIDQMLKSAEMFALAIVKLCQ